jgi:hypothetical protein
MRIAYAMLAVGSIASKAAAFTFDSPVSDGCHEEITVAAIRETGWPDGAVAPPLSRSDAILAENLPVAVDGAKDDPWLVALVIGVRFNDLDGFEALDLPALAEVHHRHDGQREHCLRTELDDGAEGDVSALDACRAFIASEIDRAIETEPGATTPVRVALAFEPTSDVEIDGYAFHAGRALHALQDSFTHSFRSPDGARIRHVLNFVDPSEASDYEVARDGFRHLSALDECHGEAAAERRAALATEASVDLLSSIADTTGGADGRRARAMQAIDAWLTLEPGCTVENDWCDAPERFEGGCSVAEPSGVAISIGFLSFALLVVRRRR